MNRKIYILLLIIFMLCGCNGTSIESTKFKIISTNFPGYDFMNAIVYGNDNVDVKMLLSPGAEIHDFELTPQDIVNIKTCDMFIYVGGESDEWVLDVINDIDTSKTRVVKLMDLVSVVKEEVVDGMQVDDDEDEDEYDEHVWTSPKNAITIINKLTEIISSLDKENKSLYIENGNNYIDSIRKIDDDIRKIVATANRKEMIFGDRFPFRYFVMEYGLSYYSAFSGCSHQTEASAKTISFLIDKVREGNIPVIFQIELSNGSIANTIAKETGAKVLVFHSAHNVSKEDFDNNITYVDIMEKNVNNLKEALK